MHQFNEHHPEFKGFSAFYDAEIHPQLLSDEAQRVREIGRLKTLSIYIAIATIFAFAIAYLFNAKLVVYPFILIFFTAFGFYLFNTRIVHVKFKTKKNIVGGICRFLGWRFQTDLAISPHIDLFKSLGLVASQFDRETYEDRMSGTAHGAAFEFYEAHLEDRQKTKNGERWVTLFRGQLLALSFDRKFHGQTVVLRDKGLFNAKKKGAMKRVGLVDPVFEKIFEAYGTDQVEARYLLTPTFMQRLVDLENSVNGKRIRFAFTGGQLLIAVETENRYEAGSMFKPLIETSRTQKILDEIGAIYDVIDGVMKPQANF